MRHENSRPAHTEPERRIRSDVVRPIPARSKRIASTSPPKETAPAPEAKQKPKKSTKKVKEKRQRSPHGLVITTVVLLLAGGLGYAGWYFYDQSSREESSAQNPATNAPLNQQLAESPPKKGILRTFSGAEFRDTYNTFAYPNTRYIEEDAIITGDPGTDQAIRTAAEARGYVRRSAPVQNNFMEVETGMLLQERATKPWQDMKTAAAEDGIELFLTAAYRSADEQRNIFLERIGGEISVSTPDFNDRLNAILASTAIPGYSRHHTGYTIDIGCGNDPVTTFDFTVCFEWLSGNNYENTKKFGYIPSYPEGAGLQGPEPETWEYVWVGLDTVTE